MKSLTVGIPAFNEEANIRVLVDEILKQQGDNFTLDEIIVISDGSTDRTVEETTKVNDKKVKVVRGKVRKGQALRQNQILEMAKSDVVIMLNADIRLGRNVLREMVKVFDGNKVDLVGAKVIPIRSNNLLPRVLNWHAKWKQYLFESINKGDNIYLCHGRARAFSRKLYSKFRWKKTWSEDAFSYLWAKKRGYGFAFASKAKIYYVQPENLSDHLKQSMRFLSRKTMFYKWFGKEFVQNEYKIPLTVWITCSVSGVIKDPLKAGAYTIIYLISWISMQLGRGPKISAVWSPSSSTKKLSEIK